MLNRPTRKAPTMTILDDSGEPFKLARKFPGYYKTTDGEWAIERGDAECEGWVGQWMVQHQVNNNLFSGPFKTLNEAIEELGAMIVSRRKGEI